MRISGIPHLASEVLFIDHEHIDAPARKLGKKLGPSHAGGLSGPRHGDSALLIPMDGCREAHLICHFMGRLAKRGKQTVRHGDVDVGHLTFLTLQVEASAIV